MLHRSWRFLTSAVAALSFLLAPVLTAVTDGYHAVGVWIHTTFDRMVGKLVSMKADPMLGFRPWVPLIVAEAYAQRIVKREVPRMEAGWRMCPSG